jgi:hypothetical protein
MKVNFRFTNENFFQLKDAMKLETNETENKQKRKKCYHMKEKREKSNKTW